MVFIWGLGGLLLCGYLYPSRAGGLVMMLVSLLLTCGLLEGGVRLMLRLDPPDLRMVREGRPAHGRGVAGEWIAITPRGAASTSGIMHRPLLPGWGGLLIVAGLALAGWLSEGRGWPRPTPQ